MRDDAWKCIMYYSVTQKYIVSKMVNKNSVGCLVRELTKKMMNSGLGHCLPHDPMATTTRHCFAAHTLGAGTPRVRWLLPLLLCLCPLLAALRCGLGLRRHLMEVDLLDSPELRTHQPHHPCGTAISTDPAICDAHTHIHTHIYVYIHTHSNMQWHGMVASTPPQRGR